MSWQRLESSTVDPTLAEGLEGRLADPLWLLARQWQSGEFRGEDAADPLLIRVAARSTLVDEVRLGDGRYQRFDPDGPPLEALVEAEPVRRGRAGSRVAAELGRVLLGALGRTPDGRLLAAQLRRRYPLRRPPDDGLDPAGRRRLDLLIGRSLDGVALAADLAADPGLAARLVTDAGAGGASAALTGLLGDWAGRSAAAFVEPATGAAWDARRLEYRFDLRATETGTQLPAKEYCGGELAWYHMDVVEPESPPAVGAAQRDLTVLPVPLRYAGMPANRLWEFEEDDVFFGGMEAGPTDLARVALAGYAISYGVDWYLVPMQVTAGSLVRVLDLEVVDTFGATASVAPAAVLDGPDRAFRFFELTGDPGPDAGLAPLLPVLPTVDAVTAPRPLEDVRFLRDESANLAWAVEQRIETATGRPIDLAARGASAAGHPAARRSDATPSGVPPSGARPSGAQPSGPRPSGAPASGVPPSGPRPSGAQPSGGQPSGAPASGGPPSGARPSGGQPSGPRPSDTTPSGPRPAPSGAEPSGPSNAADPVDDRWPFLLWTGAPDTWVPLVPVRLGPDGAILLQRGRLPDASSDALPGTGTRGARGAILEPRRRFLLHEEEIPREGLRVVRQFQAARTAAGGAFTWVGRRKGPGRGDGESGLVFDQLDPGPAPS